MLNPQGRWQRLLLALVVAVVYKLIGFLFLPFCSVFWSGLLADVVGIVAGFVFYKPEKCFDARSIRETESHITVLVTVLWIVLQFAIAWLFTGIEVVSPTREHLWLTVLVTLVAAPLCEELLFRGLLFGSLRSVMSFWPAAAISSLLFGLFHGTIPQMIAATVSGLFFAALVERYGNIVASVYAHFLFNLMSVIVMLQIDEPFVFWPVLLGGVCVAHALFGGSLLLIGLHQGMAHRMTGEYLGPSLEEHAEQAEAGSDK